ncbi:MAG: Thiolase, N-terminal domain, partial [Ilumatobacteraceae bacterium]|nr:Thiolase, N-terminal domain [Ilumatobacteraceae bacterium]
MLPFSHAHLSGLRWSTGELQTVRMRTAVIVDAVRTPLGRRNGKLQGWHPVDLV